MINIKANNLDEDNIEVNVENSTDSRGTAFVETMNIIKAAIENFHNYDDTVSRGELLAGITELLRFDWNE